MAKRELSSTLKNLKFMQRNAVKEDKKTEVEPFNPVADFGALPAPTRKCIVIMEGYPHHGGTGRLSFQNFNPDVDKLNEERANNHQNVPHTSNNGGNSERVDAASPSSSKGPRGEDEYKNTSDVDLKRKEPDEATDNTTPPKSRRTSKDDGGQSSNTKGCRAGSTKQKRDHLDWSVLRPPKPNKKD